MRFAFDRANPGWSPGRWGGLGSGHTPGSWPLGDVQEWVVASLSGQTGQAERALERLLAVAAPDGLLPEAHDSDTTLSTLMPRMMCFTSGTARGATLSCLTPRPMRANTITG